MSKWFFVLSMLYLLMTNSGCSESSQVGGTSSTSSSSSSTDSTQSTANTCSSPSTQVIYQGERSLTVSPSVRGLFSDLRMNPLSTNPYPAVAYADVGCSCIRFTFWNGSRWITEIVTAGNATNYVNVKLSFLSTGIPIIIWTNGGTTLQMAIRATSDTTVDSTWRYRALDTGGTALRPAEISVNPNDQVAILYTRNVSGSTHVILCTSGCDQVANYSSPSGTLGNSGTAANQFGLDWCYSGSTYFPVVAFSQAAQSVFAVCRQTNLANCLTGISNWGGGAVFNLTSSGTNRPATALIMDRTTADAPIRAAVNDGTTGIRMYQSSFAGGGCASGTLAAIASAGTLAGSTTFGTSQIEIRRDTAGVYHMATNDAAAGTRYFNSVGATFTTMNASGALSGSATAAASGHRIGFDVDSANNQAYATLARTSIATPLTGNGNLMFAYVENSNLASNNASAEFYEFPLTLDGQIQTLTNQVPNISLASTSASVPAVAVVDYSSPTTTTGVLKYGYRTGSSSSSSWNFRTVPIIAQPQHVALAFDQNDKPWIGIFDQQTLRFLLLTNSSSDGSGAWSTYYFPLRTAVTAATLPAFHSVALVMDKTNTAQVRPIMLVGVANHATAATTGVWSAKLNPTNGDWSNIVQVVSTNAANSVSNLTADSIGSNVVVAYYNRGTNNRIEYSHSVNAGGAYSTATSVNIQTAVGQGLAIKLNPSTTRPAISYYDKTNNRVYLAQCGSTIASCSSISNWSTTLVDNLSAGVSGIAAASDGILGTGLTFTSAGAAYVLYPIGSSNTGNLVYNQNSSGSFSTVSTVLVTGKGTNTFDNPTVSAVNFGQPGWNLQSVRAVNGALHTVYNGPGNWLYSTMCE